MNRTKTLEAFAAYTSRYDSRDPKIRLKIKHTYKVAGLCDAIGQALGLKGNDLDVAWLCGMLHDIGRFEQVRRYGTFIDRDSIDHAKLSAAILFGEDGMIHQFTDSEDYREILYRAISWHNAYRLPEDLDDRTRMYADILRDADKLDILRANLETPLEEIYDVTREELYHCQVTPEVMEAFERHQTVQRELKKTPVDHVVGQICLAFELVYPVSRQIAREQGYLKQIMEFQSEDPVTRGQFHHIREEMGNFFV